MKYDCAVLRWVANAGKESAFTTFSDNVTEFMDGYSVGDLGECIQRYGQAGWRVVGLAKTVYGYEVWFQRESVS